MTFTGTTKTIGVFGYPVTHSLSPAMQNAAIESAGLDMVYLPFSVEPSMLREAVSALRALNMTGVNLTIPHKEAVMEYLDEVSDEARVIGAVNTIVNDNGKLIGHNTDGRGYLQSVREEAGFDPAGKSIVIIGAGGAARGIINALALEGAAAIAIANRTIPRAERLAAEFKPLYPAVTITPLPLEGELLRATLHSASLVVNTTSLGMEGKGKVDIALDELPKRSIISDIVYNPRTTDLLRRAADRGLAVHGGLGMLVCQGALGFTLWTGCEAPVAVMRSAAEEALGEGE
ncbi:MAG: shikimate dehydrogenase [Deltaproteobacteria bacterium]|nr:shikimate dehydrogenase [Deltaproteobacteria bacterium]